MASPGGDGVSDAEAAAAPPPPSPRDEPRRADLAARLTGAAEAHRREHHLSSASPEAGRVAELVASGAFRQRARTAQTNRDVRAARRAHQRDERAALARAATGASTTTRAAASLRQGAVPSSARARSPAHAGRALFQRTATTPVRAGGATPVADDGTPPRPRGIRSTPGASRPAPRGHGGPGSRGGPRANTLFDEGGDASGTHDPYAALDEQLYLQDRLERLIQSPVLNALMAVGADRERDRLGSAARPNPRPRGQVERDTSEHLKELAKRLPLWCDGQPNGQTAMLVGRTIAAWDEWIEAAAGLCSAVTQEEEPMNPAKAAAIALSRAHAEFMARCTNKEVFTRGAFPWFRDVVVRRYTEHDFAQLRGRSHRAPADVYAFVVAAFRERFAPRLEAAEAARQIMHDGVRKPTDDIYVHMRQWRERRRARTSMDTSQPVAEGAWLSRITDIVNQALDDDDADPDRSRYTEDERDAIRAAVTLDPHGRALDPTYRAIMRAVFLIADRAEFTAFCAWLGSQAFAVAARTAGVDTWTAVEAAAEARHAWFIDFTVDGETSDVRPRHPFATDVSFYTRQGLPRDATGHKALLECDTATFVEFMRKRSTARPDARGPLRTAALTRYDDADPGDDSPRPATLEYDDDDVDDGYDDTDDYPAPDDAYDDGYDVLGYPLDYTDVDWQLELAEQLTISAVSIYKRPMTDAYFRVVNTWPRDGCFNCGGNHRADDPACEWYNRMRCWTCGGEHMARECPNRAKATTHAKPRDTRAPGATRASLRPQVPPGMRPRGPARGGAGGDRGRGRGARYDCCRH